MELHIPCITCAQDCNGLATIFPVLLICVKNNNKGYCPADISQELGILGHEILCEQHLLTWM